jgi:cyclophilin family peptidyl-prolyl cis-trans isomerase
LPSEFSTIPFVRGVVGMARSQSPNSANSQFFIMYDSTPSLNGQYTVVGQVIEGMEAIDELNKGPSALNGRVTDPDRIINVRVAADIKQ